MRHGGWAASLDTGLGLLVEIPAAILLLAEIAILLAGVVSRYLLASPLVWSDELASILFFWLAMLGTAVAFRRGAHMRMTALLGVVGPRRRAFLEVAALAAALAFLLMILRPAWDYAAGEGFVTTPALGIAGSWRAAALPVGALLMISIGLLRLARLGDMRLALAAVAAVAAVIAAFVALAPVFRGLGNLNLLIFFVGVAAAAIAAGVPIGFSFGLASLTYLALATHVPLMVMVGRMDEGMSHLILLAVPLFVLLGGLIELTGMAHAMVRFLVALCGHLRGGLSYVLVGAMYLVSGISGAKAADMAAVAPVLFPEMRRRGAKGGELVALLAATGAQTETIPPSLVLITIGSVTGVSIAALFTGGLLPGVVLAAILCVVVGLRHRKDDVTGLERASATEIGRSLVVALPALALPVLIRASVMEGVATATEVSTIGIAYVALIGPAIYGRLDRRRLDWRRLGAVLVDTASLSGAILFIIGAATAMGWGLTQSGFARDLVTFMAGLPGGRPTFLALSVLVFVVLGSVLEGIPAVVLFGPMLFSTARQLGVHEVHYAMVVILAMGIGLFAPPFGVGYYAACAIGRVDPAEGIRPIGAYLLALLVGTLLIAALPWISTGFL